MSNWVEIKMSDDVDVLLDEYCGFHDSCIVSADFKTGVTVDDNGAMIFAPEDERVLCIRFKSQMVLKELELCFAGVRQFCMAGWEDYYSSEITDCYLAIRTDLRLPRRDDALIVWSDNAGFNLNDVEILHEPMTNFVIASGLKWRFVDGE